MLEPTDIKIILPTICASGRYDFDPTPFEPCYTHQHIELPEIQMDVTHFILHKGKCNHYGKTVRVVVPKKYQSGYSPRLSTTVAEFNGSHRSCRQVCLAHYIRKTKALTERNDHPISRFGEIVRKPLRQLCLRAKAPPPEKQ